MKLYLTLFFLHHFNINICYVPNDVSVELHSFFTAEDLAIADSLTDDEIDKGVGKIDVNAEFNPNLYGGDMVNEPQLKKKDVIKLF